MPSLKPPVPRKQLGMRLSPDAVAQLDLVRTYLTSKHNLDRRLSQSDTVGWLIRECARRAQREGITAP